MLLERCKALFREGVCLIHLGLSPGPVMLVPALGQGIGKPTRFTVAKSIKPLQIGQELHIYFERGLLYLILSGKDHTEVEEMFVFQPLITIVRVYVRATWWCSG